MKVKFDSLNRFEVPKLYVCNPGCIFDECLTNVEGCLSDTSDEELVLNFNATSELNFRAYRIIRNDAELDRYTYNLYSKLQNRRLIYVEDVGFFVITQVVDGYDNHIRYKDIHAESCEIEIAQKTVPFIENNTYQFTELLEKLVGVMPMWKIGSIDSGVKNKYRTFEDVSEDYNILGFMLEQMQEAYECIFIFDITKRLIEVYDQNNYAIRTPIFLTRNDVINSIEVTENSDDLYTAITVFGDNNLNIAAVNPLGTSVIYNFDYYLDWMSSELRNKVTEWKALVSSKAADYLEKNKLYYDKLDEKFTAQSNIDALEIQKSLYKRMRDNAVASVTSNESNLIDQYNEAIVKNGGSAITKYNGSGGSKEALSYLTSQIDGRMRDADIAISNNSRELENIELILNQLDQDVTAIRNQVSIETFFDKKMYDELYNYIFQGSYTDEHITVTESMSNSDRFKQMQLLYERAVHNLSLVSGPTQELNLDVENFIFQKKFQEWTSQLETGRFITVELQNDVPVSLFLTNITVNYYDRTLSMTFANRLYKFDTKTMFDNLLGKIKKTHNTLNYINEILYPIKNGEFNAMREALQTSRDITMSEALAASNERVIIDESGYTGKSIIRKENGEEEFDDRQIKITGKSIVFTDDNWDSCELAIGELVIPGDNGSEERVYGVNAKVILGDMIVGNSMHIVNGDGQDVFSITEDGLVQIRTYIKDALTDIDENGVGKVKTGCGYTFNDDGLLIKRPGEDFENCLDDKGMRVRLSGEDVLIADNNGVSAKNLRSRQYLIIGENSRIQDYKQNRTGCFYIGK